MPLKVKCRFICLFAILVGALSPPARAMTHPENRVGVSPVFSCDSESQDIAKPIGTPQENPARGDDFPPGVHIYLYVEDMSQHRYKVLPPPMSMATERRALPGTSQYGVPPRLMATAVPKLALIGRKLGLIWL